MPRVQKLNPQADYYEVLNVAATATSDEIRGSFKKLVLEFHPDKNPERREWSEKRIRELIEAYEVLGDDQKRQNFDKLRRLAPKRNPEEPFFYRRKGPSSRALMILHLLLNGRSDEGVSILEQMEDEYGSDYLLEYLEKRDYLDSLFLLGEHYTQRKDFMAAVNRLRTFYMHEKRAKFPRHYLSEVIRLLKDLYLRKLPKVVAPKLLIGYLQEATTFDLSLQEDTLRLRKLAEALVSLGDIKEARRTMIEIEKLAPESKDAEHIERLLRENGQTRRSASTRHG